MATAVHANRFVEYLVDYAAHHQTPGNKLTHYVGIPLLTVVMWGLAAKVQFGPDLAGGLAAVDLGLLAWVAIAAWYVWMDWRIGIPSSLVGLAAYLLGRQIPLVPLVVLFVVGWIIQLVGHVRYEHNRPAFFKNLEHLLIGPVWVFGTWLRFLPDVPELKH